MKVNVEVYHFTAARRGRFAPAYHFISPLAMVTRYLAEMEEWAGARLLHRSTRRLSLTDAGEITLARCRKLLELAGAMEVAADDDETPKGLLRITCSPSLAHAELASAVTAFLKRYPRTSVDLQGGNRAVNLVE